MLIWIRLLAWYLVCILGLCFFFEFSLPRLFMSFLPPYFVTFFDQSEGVWPLMQTSKQSSVARDPYWAILGDSYAKGMGDGQIDSLTHISASGYAASHAIHNIVGKDIVTFAQPGSGSWRGLITNYEASYRYLKSLDIGWPARPELMIYLFYEGNDLVENVLYYRQLSQTRTSSPTISDVLSQDSLYQFVETGENSLPLFRQLLTNMTKRFIEGQSKNSIKELGGDDPAYIPIKRWLPRMNGKSLNSAMIGDKVQVLPGNLQGPALELTDEQLKQALSQFDLALSANRRLWPETPLLVVYIPSVLSCYQLHGSKIEAQNFLADDTIKVPSVQVLQRHNMLRKELSSVVEKYSVSFIDASEVLRAGCREQPLHGPKDWNHLNKQGYTLLGNWIAAQISDIFPAISVNSLKK